MKAFFHHIRTYFITGVLVVTPVWATYLVLKTLIVAMDGLLGDLIQRVAVGFYIPGLGIITLFFLIFLVGILTQNIFGRKIVQWWEALFHRVPFVRGIYATFKAIVETVSLRSKEQFNKVVLIEFPRKGQYSLAFVTGNTEGEAQEKTKEKVVNVYVPTAPNPTSGYLLFVPEEEIIPLTMSVEDGLKMIVSGGLYNPVDPTNKNSQPSSKKTDRPASDLKETGDLTGEKAK